MKPTLPSVPPNSGSEPMNETGRTLLEAYDGFLLDLDGTVYHGARVIGAARGAIETMRSAGTVRFVTNNAAKDPADVAAHLRALGIPADADEVRTSSQAAVSLLGSRVAAGRKVLVVGTDALADQVRAAGLAPVRAADSAGTDGTATGVAAVVQGHSPYTGWADLAEACVAIRAGALWVASNVDATLPAERGELPGNGAMVAALRTATGERPLVAGKPDRALLDLASRGCDRPLVIGDRLETDIAGGTAAGMDTLAVLTGVTTPDRLLHAAEGERPNYLAADLNSVRARVADLEVGPGRRWRVDVAGDCLSVSGTTVRPEEAGVLGEVSTELLRALCHAAWCSGAVTPRAEDDGARAGLAALGLPSH